MRIMFDALNPRGIPAWANDPKYIVAAYVDHPEFPYEDMVKLFPRATHVKIAAHHGYANVYDVEPGAIWPPENVIMELLLNQGDGVISTVYGTASTQTAVNDLCIQHGVKEHYKGLAEWDGIEEIPPGNYMFHQFTNNKAQGNPYDTSVAVDYWPGVDPKPVPPIIEDDDMPNMCVVVVDKATVPVGTEWPGDYLYTPNNAKLVHLVSKEDVSSFIALGATGPQSISYGQYKNLGGE